MLHGIFVLNSKFEITDKCIASDLDHAQFDLHFQYSVACLCHILSLIKFNIFYFPFEFEKEDFFKIKKIKSQTRYIWGWFTGINMLIQSHSYRIYTLLHYNWETEARKWLIFSRLMDSHGDYHLQTFLAIVEFFKSNVFNCQKIEDFSVFFLSLLYCQPFLFIIKSVNTDIFLI